MKAWRQSLGTNVPESKCLGTKLGLVYCLLAEHTPLFSSLVAAMAAQFMQPTTNPVLVLINGYNGSIFIPQDQSFERPKKLHPPTQTAFT
jgi:hypothetical protein